MLCVLSVLQLWLYCDDSLASCALIINHAEIINAEIINDNESFLDNHILKRRHHSAIPAHLFEMHAPSSFQ